MLLTSLIIFFFLILNLKKKPFFFNLSHWLSGKNMPGMPPSSVVQPTLLQSLNIICANKKNHHTEHKYNSSKVPNLFLLLPSLMQLVSINSTGSWISATSSNSDPSFIIRFIQCICSFLVGLNPKKVGNNQVLKLNFH